MMIRTLSAIGMLAASLSAVGQADIEAEMRRLAKESYARDRSYEIEAVKAFFAVGATAKCAPSTAPTPQPFEVFLEVLPDGALGRAVFVPLTKTAECINAEMAAVTFPKPPFKYVAHIHLSFKR